MQIHATGRLGRLVGLGVVDRGVVHGGDSTGGPGGTASIAPTLRIVTGRSRDTDREGRALASDAVSVTSPADRVERAGRNANGGANGTTEIKTAGAAVRHRTSVGRLAPREAILGNIPPKLGGHASPCVTGWSITRR
jgi:hypothetical protein